MKYPILTRLSRNFYTGMIAVKAYGKEPAQVVPGLHLPIVDRETYTKVQNVLNGKRPNFQFGINRSPEYPLRQYIICPVCGRGLTASSSTSRDGSKHHYYHCMDNDCKVRYRLNDVHSDFDGYLQTIKVDQHILELYSTILEDVFKMDDHEELQEIKRLATQEELVQTRIKRVEDSYFDGITPASEYRSAMERYRKEAATIHEQIQAKQGERTPYRKYISYGFIVDRPPPGVL